MVSFVNTSSSEVCSRRSSRSERPARATASNTRFGDLAAVDLELDPHERRIGLQQGHFGDALHAWRRPPSTCSKRARSPRPSSVSCCVPSPAVRSSAGRALAHEPAAMDDQHAPADGLDLGQDVRREQHRLLAREPADQIAHLADLVRVEAGRRLVEDQERRVGDQRVRKADALSVALGELPDDPVAHVR